MSTHTTQIERVLAQAYLTIALEKLDVSRARALVESVQSVLAMSAASVSLPPMPLTFGLGLDVGLTRKEQQDCVFAFTGFTAQTHQPYGLFVVADGMGGHSHGALASQLAVETMVSTMLPLLHQQHTSQGPLGDFLVEAVRQANAVVYKQNQRIANVRDLMGTTITAAAVLGPEAAIVNVGDSRTYLYRPLSGLRAITQDHSVVAKMVASGVIAPQDIYTHPKRNQIFRCLGEKATVEVDVFEEHLADGDLLLCCSDGLWEMARDQQIEQVFSSLLPPEITAGRLVQLARQGGGADNIGLVVAQWGRDVSTMPTMLLAPMAPRAAFQERVS